MIDVTTVYWQIETLNGANNQKNDKSFENILANIWIISVQYLRFSHYYLTRNIATQMARGNNLFIITFVYPHLTTLV